MPLPATLATPLLLKAGSVLLIVALSAFGALGFGYYTRGLQLERARIDTAKTKLQADENMKALIDCRSSTAVQNQAINELLAATERRAAAAAEALEKVRTEAARSQESTRRLQAAMNAARDSSNGSCAAGVAAVRKELRK